MHTSIAKTLLTGILAALCLGAPAVCDPISGTISVSGPVLHTGGTASSLQESIDSFFSWTLASTETNVLSLSCLYSASGSLAGGATNTLDLYGAVLDSFGATVKLARVKLLVFCPSNAIAATATIRPAAAAGFTNWCDAAEGVTVRAGGALAFFAPDLTGYPVSNSVCDSLEIVNNATNSATYKLYIGGQ
jgi:hypothetical protein